jgi:glyoxylase-like metal-dependent hydrolase (beta-lactamase superfamily II)
MAAPFFKTEDKREYRRRSSSRPGFWVGMLALLVLSARTVPAGETEKVVFLTYVSNSAQARAAAILLRSLRTFGGEQAKAPFFAAQVNPREWSADHLKKNGAELIPVPAAPGNLRYPFLNKVLALAAAEEHLRETARMVVYLDAENVVLGEPSGWLPAAGKRMAIRPVHLVNQVGVKAELPLDAYWDGIYSQLGRPPGPQTPVRSLVDQQDIHPYFSTVAMGFDPTLGLMAEWKNASLALMADKSFQETVCGDPFHQNFLHQAILSALLTLRLSSDQIQVPTHLAHYPMQLHPRITAERQTPSLDAVSCLYVDTLWQTRLDWWLDLPGNDRTRAFLAQAQEDYHTVRPGLYWEAGSALAYLITTPAGHVLVDPGGAASPQAFLRRLPGQVQAIVLTHTHTDHTQGTASWWRTGVPVIAQQEWKNFRAYHERLSGFFTRRDAAQGNVLPRPADDPWPDLSFRDQYVLQLGGHRFEFFHAPGETPDHTLLWIPHLQAAFVGDNVFGAFPNLAPPRGCPPRWALDWIASLDRLLALEPEYLCAGHLEPLAGKDTIRAFVTRFREAIRFVHDATVQGMNDGKPIETLIREIKLPPELALPETYARVAWAVRGIALAYGGWFDENPATLLNTSRDAVASDLLALAGGTGPLLKLAQSHLQDGEPAKALHLLDLLLASRPDEEAARVLRRQVLKALADISTTYVERNWLQSEIKK